MVCFQGEHLDRWEKLFTIGNAESSRTFIEQCPALRTNGYITFLTTYPQREIITHD